MKTGRKIYYELATGNVILTVQELVGDVVETTIEQDFAGYVELAARVPETVGCISLPHGQLRSDFDICSSYRIDLETGEIVFKYDRTEDPEQPSVYQKPLSEQVNAQETRLSDIELAIAQIMMGGNG